MSAASIAGPLVGRVLPGEGWARTASLAGIAVLVSLILWASAKISVPFWPVPMTLQTGAVALIGLTCGWRLGLAAVILYLAEGAAGLPVFQGTPEKGIGLAYLLGPTGGYLIGMALQVVVTGWLAERVLRGGVPKSLAAALAGDVVLFACGLLWLGTLIGWDKPVLALGLYPFVLADLVKMALAACAASAGWRLARP